MSCAGKTLNPCPEQISPGCTVPTYAFMEQEPFGISNAEALSDSQTLQHNEPFVLVTGTYYQFNGSLFLFLGPEERMHFTAHPKLPLSSPFFFTAHKYPLATSAAGGAPLQSRGTTIREGDTIFLTSNASKLALAQYKPPSPYALPQFVVPSGDAVENFQQYGTQDGACMRIISETFDDAVAPDDQPPVQLDGSRAYFFMLTRIGQVLQVLPGASPAPNAVHTSGFRGAESRLIPLKARDFYNRIEDVQAQREQAEQAAANAVAAASNTAAATAITQAENEAAQSVAQTALTNAKNAAVVAKQANDATVKAVQNGNAQLAVNAAQQANAASKDAVKAAQTAIGAANAIAGKNASVNAAASTAVDAARAAQELARNATNTASLIAVNSKTAATH